MQENRQKQFENKVYEQVKDEYSIIGSYINSTTKILIKHNSIKCGKEFEMTPQKFLKKDRKGIICPYCNINSNKKTHQDFIKELEETYGNEFTVLSEYKGAHNPIIIRHNNCNYEYQIEPNVILRRKSCPMCNKSKTRNTEMLKYEVREKTGNEYVVLDEYINCRTPITFKHNIPSCNYEFKMAPNNFLSQGQRCPNCKNKHISIQKTKTHKKFIEEVYNLVKDEYKVLSLYKGCDKKVTIKHNIDSCGYVWNIEARNFVAYGQRCPRCQCSHGEQMIEKWFKNNNMEVNRDYIPQKEFEGLVGLKGGSLSYDFYLSKYNSLIEYQGEFHDGNGSYYIKKNLERQREHDKRKKEYAIDNKIKLLNIWYWDFDNIEQILDEYILNNKINQIDGYIINASQNSKPQEGKTI